MSAMLVGQMVHGCFPDTKTQTSQRKQILGGNIALESACIVSFETMPKPVFSLGLGATAFATA
jgi:hypothetical protein